MPVMRVGSKHAIHSKNFLRYSGNVFEIKEVTNLGRPVGLTGTHFAVMAEPPEAGVFSRYGEVVKFRNEVVEANRGLHLLEAERRFALKRCIQNEAGCA